VGSVSISSHECLYKSANEFRARCTSAAPIYFQPYKIERTRREYIDGAVRKNNPIQLANQERQLIWPKGCNRPDIILSVGAGLQTYDSGATKGVKTSKTKQILKLVPKGLRKKLTTGYDMIVSTLDCEKEWQEFLGSMRHDKRFISVCHRLNVGLYEKPPKLDEVDALVSLQQEASNFLMRGSDLSCLSGQYVNTYTHIRAIASRLVASLFYFEEIVDGVETEQTQKPRRVTGCLRCRLSPLMAAQFRSIVKANPEFRIFEDGSVARELKQPDWDPRTFSSGLVQFLVNKDGWRIEIKFPSRSFWQSISGYT
jgi:hypothetical protein